MPQLFLQSHGNRKNHSHTQEKRPPKVRKIKALDHSNKSTPVREKGRGVIPSPAHAVPPLRRSIIATELGGVCVDSFHPFFP